jgi:germination protein M
METMIRMCPGGAPGPRLHGSLAAVAIAVLLAAGACGTMSPTVTPGIETGRPTAGRNSLPVRAYFILGSFVDNAGLVPVERSVDEGLGGAIEGEAIKALLAGPNDAELGGRPAMFTDIPAGTRLLNLSIKGDGAIIDLSGEFDDEGRAGSLRGRLAQVVYTLTQFPGITSVLLLIDGNAVGSFGSEGIATAEPFERNDFADQLPPIFVDQPAWGSVIPNPLRMSGLADVFEATFHVRILDAGGRSLADGPVMASCGSGCLGTFDVTVPYAATAAAPATLQVYELSAADGSVINLTEYPVTLSPGP